MPSRKAQLVSPLPGEYLSVPGISVTGVITATGGITGVVGVAQSITDGADLDLGTVTATTFVGDSIGTYRATGLINTGAGTSNLNVGVVTATSISGVVTGNITGTASSIISGANLTVGVATAVTWLGDGSGVTGAGSSAFIGQSVPDNKTFSINVTSPAGGNYTLSGTDRSGTVSGSSDPAVTVEIGDTLNFVVDASGHPFYIRVSDGGANVSTPAATNQGAQSGTVSWTPNTAGTYYYQCGNHAGMLGTITVTATTTIDLSAGNLINFTHSNNTTVAFANTSTASRVTFIRTTTANTITWPRSITWSGLGDEGASPVLISNSRTTAFQVFNLTTADAGVTWYGWESFEDDPQTFTLWSWGYNYRGQLGQNDTTQYSSPKQVPGTNWLMTNNGCSYVSNNVSIATKSDGTIWSWGYGSRGMLGLNQSSPSAKISSPTQIGSNTNWGVGSSSRSVLWSKTDGTLWSWGYNGDGQLGLNESGPGTPKKSSPTQVGTSSDWATSHSTGGKYASDQNSPDGRTGAIKNDGSLWMMGKGALGQNETTNYSSPVQIPGSDWKSISLSGGGSLALKTNGTAWAWGSNSNGNMGQNDRTLYSSPIQIPGKWASITAGRSNSSGVKTDGTLWGWGQNNYGQLGLGDETSYSSPVQVGTNDTWSTNAFAAGAMGYLYNTTYLKNDGSLWTWGSNVKGQLGTSLPVNSHRSSPVQVPGTWGGVTKSGQTVVAHQFTA